MRIGFVAEGFFFHRKILSYRDYNMKRETAVFSFLVS
jgi:hypothetical protein